MNVMKEVVLADPRPSGFARTIACPGSRRMEGKAKPRGTSSVYAREGTAAHELCYRCLTTGTLPLEHAGETIVAEGEGFEVDAEMMVATQHFVGHCRKILAGDVIEYFIEEKLVIPGLDMRRGGTGDFVALSHGTKYPYVLDVVDLKYGKGVYVNEVGNAQFLAYAWGAVNSMSTSLGEDMAGDVLLRMTVVQPRHSGGKPVRPWTITLRDLYDWLKNVATPAVEASRNPSAPLVPGDHCGFCDAKGFCTAPLQHMADSMKSMQL